LTSDNGVKRAADVDSTGVSGVNREPNNSTTKLIYYRHHRVNPHVDEFAFEKINRLKAICRITDKREPSK
jgi:hypothetical protein